MLKKKTDRAARIDLNRQAFGNNDINDFLKEVIPKKKHDFLCPEMGGWLEYCYGGFINERESKENIIRMLHVYRGAGKTEIVTSLGIAWLLLLFPTTSIGVYSKQIDFSMLILKNIGKILSRPKYLALFNSIYLTKYKSLLEEDTLKTKTLNLKYFSENNTKTPTLTALGIGGNDTGHHFDVLVFDDVVSSQDHLSISDRNHCETRIIDILSNILNKGGLGVFIGTPHHEEDVYAYLDKVYSDTYSTTDYAFKKYPLGSLSKNTPEEIERIKNAAITLGGIRNYERHYLLILRKDDVNEPFTNLVKGKIKDSRNFENIEKVIGAIDPAYSGKNNTAVVVLFKLKTSNKIYCVGKMWLESSLIVAPKIVNFLRNYDATEIYIEINKDEGYLTDIIRGIYNKANDYASIFPIRNTATKQTRIYANIAPSLEDLVFLDEECDRGFISEIKNWNVEAKLDDAPDALALGLKEGFPRNNPIEAGSVFHFYDNIGMT